MTNKLKKVSTEEWTDYLEKGDDPNPTEQEPWQACYQKVESKRYLCFPWSKDVCGNCPNWTKSTNKEDV